MENRFYKVSLGNDSVVCLAADAMAKAGEFVLKQGGGIPKIEECDEHGNPLVKQNEPVNNVPTTNTVSTTAEVPTAPQYSSWGATVVDQTAKTRIENLHRAVEAVGGPKIDTSKQFFATGTRMAQEGYATQTKRQQDFQKMMPLTEAIEKLTMAVDKEMRVDEELSANIIADSVELENSNLLVRGRSLTERALQQMITRLKSPALNYLLGLRERALSVLRDPAGDKKHVQSDLERMADILRYELKRASNVAFKLRMRNNPRDVYAALSPGFGIADAPEVMDQILERMPKDAKGTWDYDAENTSWCLKANIWTPVPVAEQAVGEPFEGHVSLNSRDNGTGSFNGGGGINILRCLNASTYTAGEAMSRVHRGKIMFDIRGMIDKSLRAVDALCAAWGIARKAEVDVPKGMSLNEALPGFWRCLLRDKELVGVLPGRKENHARELTQTYFSERRNPEKVVRSDFAQSWTRYIQGQPTEVRRNAEQAIGAWLVKSDAPIRYLKEKE